MVRLHIYRDCKKNAETKCFFCSCVDRHPNEILYVSMTILIRRFQSTINKCSPQDLQFPKLQDATPLLTYLKYDAPFIKKKKNIKNESEYVQNDLHLQSTQYVQRRIDGNTHTTDSIMLPAIMGRQFVNFPFPVVE